MYKRVLLLQQSKNLCVVGQNMQSLFLSFKIPPTSFYLTSLIGPLYI